MLTVLATEILVCSLLQTKAYLHFVTERRDESEEIGFQTKSWQPYDQIPVPEKLTVCGLAGSESVMVRFAV